MSSLERVGKRTTEWLEQLDKPNRTYQIHNQIP